MRFLIVGVCTLLLLGCSFTSNKSGDGAIQSVIINDGRVDGSQPIIAPGTNPKRVETVEGKIGEQSFTLEVSGTPSERELGLMYRESMQYNEGMLFVFDAPARHRFWMKDTLIPLDILWLDENKTVIDFKTANPCYKDPCEVISPSGVAKYVIELPAGSFVESVGTTVTF